MNNFIRKIDLKLIAFLFLFLFLMIPNEELDYEL